MTIEELEKLLASEKAVTLYLSTQYCNVCKVLKPKVKEFLINEFPEIKFEYIDIEIDKEIAGKYSVFAVPTMIFFFEGKEAFRKSRYFSIAELYDALERPYSMLFS